MEWEKGRVLHLALCFRKLTFFSTARVERSRSAESSGGSATSTAGRGRLPGKDGNDAFGGAAALRTLHLVGAFAEGFEGFAALTAEILEDGHGFLLSNMRKYILFRH
jgi:hypothetical protein